jgi:hypothetical protein
MKRSWVWAVTAAVAMGGYTTSALSQTYELTDGDVSAVSFSNDDCGCAAPDCGCDTAGCDDASDCSAPSCETACNSCCDEPWVLFGPMAGGITVDGWIAAGATANADNPADRYNGPVSFNDRNEVQLNQLYVSIGKATDPCECFSVGGRVDLLYGTDYIFTQAAGLETRRNGDPKWNSRDHYGLAMPQMYIEFAYNDLSVKVGHFYTIIGNEVVTAPGNFFYSHSYTMQYGEPFTHTGVLADYKYSDSVTLLGGIHGGWDSFDPVRQRAGFLGGATWSNCDESVNLAFMLTSGHELNNMGTFTNRTMYSLVGSLALTDNLDYVIQHDNGWQEDWFGANQDAEWYGLNQYLLYTINDCWKAGARFEWFRDDDGTRVAGVRNGNPAAGPFQGNFYEATLGLNWTPSSNLTVRPEVRWDWFDGATNPYDGGTKDDQFTAAFDAIMTF